MRNRGLPEPLQPFRTDTEFMAWVFNQLASTYMRLAEYERADERRRNEEIYNDLNSARAAQKAGNADT